MPEKIKVIIILVLIGIGFCLLPPHSVPAFLSGSFIGVAIALWCASKDK